MHSEASIKGRQARAAAGMISTAPSSLKNRALELIAVGLETKTYDILSANAEDLARLEEKSGYTSAFHDRLLLNEQRIAAMATGVRQIADLEDPVGEITGMKTRPNGLQIGQVRVPLGVIGVIYEARPNVTVDAAALALKAGNAVVLRGSSEAISSNMALVGIIQEQLTEAGLPGELVSLIEDGDRASALELMRLDDFLDVLIPRGGSSLIRAAVENSTVPVIETGTGNCHTYIDEGADMEMALEIAVNAKVQRPGVCNSMETLLVHSKAAEVFLPDAVKRLLEHDVRLRGCPVAMQYHDAIEPAGEEDWRTEYLDLILAIRVVDSLSEAVKHISLYGSGHSECIVTRDYERAREFLNRIDAAAVYVNASTRFTDGFEFGLGAEMGISTQKLHARGPMGLKALTSLKYVIYGSGQVR